MRNPLDLWRRGASGDPFREWTTWNRDLDRAFDDMLTPRMRQNLDKVVLTPNCDLTESKMAYNLKFDLPGVTKENVKIDLHDNILTVSGERKEEKREEDKEKRIHLNEVYYGSFSRSFTFPEGIDVERSEAKFEGGVLMISVPKKEGAAKRQISIK